MQKTKKESATGCATDATGLLNMTEYGNRIGGSRQRVGKYIEKGYISESSYTRRGNKVLINPEIADADLDASLSGSQLIKATLTTAPENSVATPPVSKIDAITDGIDRKEADRRKAIAQARHCEVKTKILEGQYVEREWAEMQLAGRAMVLKSDMENFFRSRAAEIIAKCDGKGIDRPRCLMFGELPSWYSPFVSLSTVLGEFFKSKDDPQKYMAYVTQHQARSWKEVLDKKDDDQVLSHSTEMEPGIVPPGCIALTAGIDMQKYGFWFVIRAWEPDLTSHLVQYGQLSTWEEVEYLVYESRYERFDGAGETMGIWRAALDTGGGQSSEGDWSRTEEAYQWIRSHRPGVVFGIKGKGGKKNTVKADNRFRYG